MCRKKIWAWLIGMMMTGVMPGGDFRIESIASQEDETTNFEKETDNGSYLGVGSQTKWRYGEPQVADLLTDPIVQMLMKSDGVSAESLAIAIKAVRENAVAKDKSDMG